MFECLYNLDLNNLDGRLDSLWMEIILSISLTLFLSGCECALVCMDSHCKLKICLHTQWTLHTHNLYVCLPIYYVCNTKNPI